MSTRGQRMKGPREWLSVHYAVTAADVVRIEAAREDVRKRTLGLVAHGLVKWLGLRPAVLREHALHIENRWVMYGQQHLLKIHDQSCALCVAYYDGKHEQQCGSCPLFKTLGFACDFTPLVYFAVRAPYQHWCATNDPEPMIDVLRETRAMIANNKTGDARP